MSIPFKISTFEQSTQPVQVEPATPAEPIVTQTEPVITEPSTTVVDDKGQLQNTEQQAPITTEPVQTPSDTVEFKMPSFEAPTSPTETKEGVQHQITSWKDAIKNVDRKELLKEAGLDDFDIEFSDYRKNGGDPYKYVAINGIDYNKISDDVLAKESLKQEYPFLDEIRLNKLFISRYKQNEEANEDERELGDIQKQYDASKYRQKMIAEQQQFKMPQVQQQQQAQPQDNAEQEKQIARTQQLVQYLNNNEATKSLIESKRVAINLGENVLPFKYNIDKPESLLSHALDGKKWARAIAINPEEPDETKLMPDVHKIQRLVIAALNPNYEKDIFNYGMSYGHEKEIEKGMNAKKPDSKPSIPSKETLKDAWKTRAKVSTYGAPN